MVRSTHQRIGKTGDPGRRGSPFHFARLLRKGPSFASGRAALSTKPASTRRQVLEQYKPTLSLTGNRGHGAEIFDRLCVTCHALGGKGNAVGPDLRVLTDRSTQALMIDILDPNAAVDGKFVNYLVETKDGRTLSGIIESESSGAITLLQPNAIRDSIPRLEIKQMRSTGLSLMPEGLEAGLAPQDLADLIEFVRAAGAP